MIVSAHDCTLPSREEERQNHALVRAAWATRMVGCCPADPCLSTWGLGWRIQLWFEGIKTCGKHCGAFHWLLFFLQGLWGEAGVCQRAYWHCYSGRGDWSPTETFLIKLSQQYFISAFLLSRECGYPSALVELLFYLCFIKPLGKKRS